MLINDFCNILFSLSCQNEPAVFKVQIQVRKSSEPLLLWSFIDIIYLIIQIHTEV